MNYSVASGLKSASRLKLTPAVALLQFAADALASAVFRSEKQPGLVNLAFGIGRANIFEVARQIIGAVLHRSWLSARYKRSPRWVFPCRAFPNPGFGHLYFTLAPPYRYLGCCCSDYRKPAFPAERGIDTAVSRETRPLPKLASAAIHTDRGRADANEVNLIFMISSDKFAPCHRCLWAFSRMFSRADGVANAAVARIRPAYAIRFLHSAQQLAHREFIRVPSVHRTFHRDLRSFAAASCFNAIQFIDVPTNHLVFSHLRNLEAFRRRARCLYLHPQQCCSPPSCPWRASLRRMS